MNGDWYWQTIEMAHDVKAPLTVGAFEFGGGGYRVEDRNGARVCSFVDEYQAHAYVRAMNGAVKYQRPPAEATR